MQANEQCDIKMLIVLLSAGAVVQGLHPQQPPRRGQGDAGGCAGVCEAQVRGHGADGHAHPAEAPGQPTQWFLRLWGPSAGGLQPQEAQLEPSAGCR